MDRALNSMCSASSQKMKCVLSIKESYVKFSLETFFLRGYIEWQSFLECPQMDVTHYIYIPVQHRSCILAGFESTLYMLTC